MYPAIMLMSQYEKGVAVSFPPSVPYPSQIAPDVFSYCDKTGGTLQERFVMPAKKGLTWEVNEDGCWNVTSHLPDTDGGVRVWQSHVRVSAYRFMWERVHGPIPKGMCVLHTCDNRLCINPDHLWLGTIADNNLDRAKKGRSVNRKGEANTQAKLMAADVFFIREHTEIKQDDIAILFGIDQSTVSNIRCGRRWKHLTGRKP